MREVVGRENYNVFHMLPCSTISVSEVQLKPLRASADLELAVVDLVGDLAAYRPSGKVVIFEGGGDSDFDRKVVAALFPELQSKANLISGSNKARVRVLHQVLQSAANQGQLPFQFFAVTDKDSEGGDLPMAPINAFRWDVYHIENYFLEVAYIRKVLKSLGLATPPSDEQILDDLRGCARETLPQLVRHRLCGHANDVLVSAVDTGIDPKKGDISAEVQAAIARSADRFTKRANEMNLDELRKLEGDARFEFETALNDGTWIKVFRGRDVLKRFGGKWASSVPYDVFRNLILSRMQDDGFQPEGMKTIIQKIIDG